MTDDRSAFTEAREDLKTPDEWSRLEGVEVMDPDGWRGRNGRPWTDPITLAEFKNRLITSTLRHAVGASTKARAEFAAARDAGLQRRHETREARALIDQIAKTLDPEAFDETRRRSSHPAAKIQWEARKFMARESAAKVMRPIAEAVDLCWKATPYGSTEDGDTAAYILPKGVVHRLVGALQGIGVSASLRAIEAPEETS